MSAQEFDRLKTIQTVVDGNLRPAAAASRLCLTRRQIDRLVARYRCDGIGGLVSRKRGQQHNRLPLEIKEAVLTIVRDRYHDFGPTLACEKLCELHGMNIGKETVRRWMTDAGLWIPRKLRSPVIYQPRNRRHCLGELIQIDGSEHAWFEQRGPECTLLVYIDDATSKLMHLHFTFSESTFSYFEATRQYLELHGKPQAFYSDKASVFRCNRKSVVGGDGHTQFGRALYELNIESICANSSQAKGRVERANLTLQDRLVKELRLRGISTMEEANAYVPTFIADFNRRFGKPPRNDFNAHRPVRNDENLDWIFTWREERKVSQTLTLQYDKTMYLLEDNKATRKLKGKYIEVAEYPGGEVKLRFNDQDIAYTTYDKLPVVDQGAIVENKRLSHVLQVAQVMQQQRDSRRSLSGPSHAHRGEGPVPINRPPGTKSQRQLNATDLEHAIRLA